MSEEKKLYIPHWFKPLKGKPRKYQILGFDIEGSADGVGFICGAIVGEYICEFHTDRDQMWRALRSYGSQDYLLFAHNLEYDLPILEGDGFPMNDLIYLSSGLLKADYNYHGRKARFRDTMMLFPRHSLAAIGSLVDLEKLEIDPLILKRMASGSSWASFTPAQQEKIRKYCERDSEIVYKAVEMLQELTLELGGQLKPTLSGIAMDIFRRRYHRWPWRAIGPKTNKLIRPAYYGGRVESFSVGQVEGVNMYDVTSLYPSVQSKARFPHPNKMNLHVYPYIPKKWLEQEGIAKVSIDVPETFIPIMPYRHWKRLFFPYGRMIGGWPLVEIRRALEAGCKLHSVEWVLSSEVTFNPFEHFVNGIFSLREFYLAEDMGVANLLKLILNSLYGRWGINPEKGLFKLINYEHVTDIENYQGWTTHDIGGNLCAYGKIENTRHPDYCNIFFAAQIAAEARIFLFDELERQGEKAVYCDTDSIITKGSIPEGSGLGSWRLQMENGQADLIGPKEYALHNKYHASVYKCKGVPPKLAKEYMEKGHIRYKRAVTVREALNKGLRPSSWVETVQSTNVIIPKRWALDDPEIEPGPGFVTHPYHVQQLRLLVGRSGLPVEIEPPSQEKIFPVGEIPLQPELIEPE